MDKFKADAPLENQSNASNDALLIDFSGRDLTHNLFWIFFCVNAILLLLDLTMAYGKLIDVLAVRQLFNMTREESLANYIGSFQTLCVGCVLAFIWIHARISKLPKHLTRFWGLLSLFFIYLAFDDAAGLHERYSSILISIFKGSASDPGLAKKVFSIFPSYSWQLLLGPALAWMLYLMIKYFRQEVPDKNQRGVLRRAILYYILAVFLDFAQGINGFFEVFARNLSVRTYTVSHFFTAGEEFLELLGTTFFLAGFTQIFLSKVRTLKVVFSSAPAGNSAPGKIL